MFLDFLAFQLSIIIRYIILSFLGSETILKGVELSEQQYLGVKLAIRYGNQLKLLQSSAENHHNLVLLLKKTKCFLQGQQHKPSQSTLSILLFFLTTFTK